MTLTFSLLPRGLKIGEELDMIEAYKCAKFERNRPTRLGGARPTDRQTYRHDDQHTFENDSFRK